uniref:Uncharacterized protein n=1 Tax=Panagrolaimus sp. ES5 TaxID=591445 RepID=A0AC34FE20_9BILA
MLIHMVKIVNLINISKKNIVCHVKKRNKAVFASLISLFYLSLFKFTSIFIYVVYLYDDRFFNGICGLQPHCYGSYPGYGSYGNGIGGGSGGGGGGGGGGCGGGCQSNYGCGQYGCYPSRQCGSKTFHPPERIERKKKMQAARLMAIERGELPQKSITETENLEYTSYTASLVKRFPTARLCAANGVCGGQPNCYGGAQPGYGGAYGGQSGCGRCQTMYGCGNYGCYRMRARGSRSFQPGNERFRAAAAESFEDSEEEPRRPLSDMESLQFASETAAIIRRNPTARLVKIIYHFIKNNTGSRQNH